MAKHNVSHIFAVYLGTGQRFAHHLRCQFGGGNVLEAAAIGSDGGANTADDDYFT